MFPWDWNSFCLEMPMTMAGVALEIFGLWACWYVRDKALFTAYLMANLLISSMFANTLVVWAGVPTVPGQMPMVFAMLGLGLAYATLGRTETYRVWRACVLALLFHYMWTHRYQLVPELPGYNTAEHYRLIVDHVGRSAMAVLGSFIYVGAPLQLLWGRMRHQPPWVAYTVSMLIGTLIGAIEFTTVAITGMNFSTTWVEVVTSVFIFRALLVAMGLPVVIALIHLDHVRTNDAGNKLEQAHG